MKICLINPPLEDFYITGVRRQPLGLLYIASSLKAAGYNPVLLNCHSKKKSRMELPSEFRYLRKYINSNNPELKFPYSNYTHYGMSWQEIENRIKQIKADIYMISSLFTTYHQETERIISLIKKHSTHAVTVLGGYHPSLYPEYNLSTANADIIIQGEGELPSVMLADAIRDGNKIEDIPGILNRGSSISRRNTALNINANIPLPDRSLLLNRDFSAYGKKITSMITSRGCPNRCSFCTGKIIWGDRYTERKIDDVIDEILQCIEKFDTQIINFEDDNIFPSKERATALLQRIITEKEKRKITCEFTAMNGISIEKVDDEVISMMKRAGFNEINISLVTHSSNLQEAEHRPFNSDKFNQIAESAKTCRMNVRAYFILGLPGQDIIEVRNTISFLNKLKIKIFPSVYYNIYSPPGEWKMQRSSGFFNETANLCRDDIVRYFNAALS